MICKICGKQCKEYKNNVCSECSTSGVEYNTREVSFNEKTMPVILCDCGGTILDNGVTVFPQYQCSRCGKAIDMINI